MMPPWHFVAMGASMAAALVLISVHLLFVPLLLVAMGGFALIEHRRGANKVDERVKKRIANGAPMPGVWVAAAAVPLFVMPALFVITGQWGPESGLPWWAVVAIACAAGVAVAVLFWKSEIARMAGTQRVEKQLRESASTSDTRHVKTEGKPWV